MRKRIFLLIVSIFVANSVLANPLVEPKCKNLKEAVGLESILNVEQAESVHKWLLRCDSDNAQLLQAMKYWIDPDRQEIVRPFLPIYGVKVAVEDPDSVAGVSYEYGNPLNYKLNIQAIVNSPETAPCDIPEDYEIIGFCTI